CLSAKSRITSRNAACSSESSKSMSGRFREEREVTAVAEGAPREAHGFVARPLVDVSADEVRGETRPFGQVHQGDDVGRVERGAELAPHDRERVHDSVAAAVEP